MYAVSWLRWSGQGVMDGLGQTCTVRPVHSARYPKRASKQWACPRNRLEQAPGTGKNKYRIFIVVLNFCLPY
eukprot:SAG11_NODE_239_length_11783_cov_52.724923_12_plen_72_part_00